MTLAFVASAQAFVHVRQVASPAIAAVLMPAANAAGELPRMHSLLVSQGGELVLERYYNGTRADRPANIKSASKSVISALVGIAIERGHLSGLDHAIGDIFPDLLAGEENATRRSITIGDLLSMRSGLESTSNRNYGAWVLSRNWVRFALAQDLISEPGTSMEYSTGNTHLLSAVLTKVTGKSTWQFAQDQLARPLGFDLQRWPQDPQGIYFGGNDMLMTPRQMLAFGELYLRGGTVGGRQIVPESWVELSTVPLTRSPISGQEYGYGWWFRNLGGHDTFYAWGFGGQYIFVVRDLDLVVVATSAATVDDERREHRRTVYDLVEQFIIAPLGAE
ncbi:MAG: serine hydrolase domain-containing protein [Vicinamibacterales bacterium]